MSSSDLASRIRLIRHITVFLLSIVIWFAVVGCFVWLRWEGGRTATDAYIPLRPLSAREAAALMTYKTKSGRPGSVIFRLTDEYAYLVTDYYLLPESSDPVESFATVRHGDSAYRIYSASWEGYSNSHRLDRSALEREIGRRLTDQDLDTSLKASPASFASDHVWAYALIEILFLASLTTTTFLLLRKAKTPWRAIPVLALPWLAIFLFVPAYSPAFMDADWFHQRVFIERLWRVSGIVSVLAGVIGVFVCVAWFLSRAQRMANRSWGIGAARFWGISAVVLVGVLVSAVAADLAAWKRMETGAKETLERVEMLLDATRIEYLREAAKPLPEYCNLYKQALVSAEVMRKIDQVLDAKAQDTRLALGVFVPLNGERYFYLSNREVFRYADVRKLQSSPMVRQLHHDKITGMLRDTKAYHSDFLSYLGGQFVEGRPFVGDNGDVLAVCLVDTVGARTEPNLEFLRDVVPKAVGSVLFSVFYLPHRISEWFWRA